jgi:hypothetical protein
MRFKCGLNVVLVGGESCLVVRDFLVIDNSFTAAYCRRLLYVAVAHVKTNLSVWNHSFFSLRDRL